MRLGLRHKQHHLVVDVQSEHGRYAIAVDGQAYVVEAHFLDAATVLLVIDGHRYRLDLARNGRERLIAVGGEVYTFLPDSAAPSVHSVATVVSPQITAPMPGKVREVLVQPGDHIEPGDGLLVLEAMKMETRLTAEAAGTVAEVRVAAGDTVDGGQVLLVLHYAEETAP
jgi:propionyl-CoA carboxylase alpha chain